MSIFDAYNQEFASLSADISKNISEYKSSPSGGDKAANIDRHLDALFSQATDLVKQMEVEVRSLDAASRKVLSDKVVGNILFLYSSIALNHRLPIYSLHKLSYHYFPHLGYKKSLASMKTDFQSVKERAEREQLVGGVGGKSLEQRQRLLDTNDKLNRQNDVILNATRTVAETEVT